MERNKILSMQDLVVKFRVRSRVLTSIRNVSFDIYDGETVAIVGESGSGKSVLMKTLTNMLESNGYISNGSIIYHPVEKAKNSPLTFFKEDIDLVKFHKNALDPDSRRGIRKYNEIKIKRLQNEIKVLKSLSIEDLNDKILETKEKIKQLNDLNLANGKRELKAKDKLASKLKDYQTQLELVKCPAQLELEIQKLGQMIAVTEQEIASFDLISITKKIRYCQIINFVKQFWKTKELNVPVLDKHIATLNSLRYHNELEDAILTVLNGLKTAPKSVPESQITSLLETWKFYKKPNWFIRLQTNKNLKHLRGGTIATIFQDPMTSLNPLLSVGYQISEVLRAHQQMNHAEAKQEAINLMERVGIPNAELRYRDLPGKYSGGMRQRVVIAIALACRPKILICDEPTTALDVTIQAQILELIKELKKEYGFTVVFITHDLGVVANIADRVAVVYAGQIIEYGLTTEIFTNSQHPYTWALLSSLPQLGQKGEDLFSIPGTPPSLFNVIKGDSFSPRNKYALAVDYEFEPPFFKVSPTHSAKTWLLDPRAPKVKVPKELTTLVNTIKNAGG